ncbi:chemotaxis protein CheB [Streptomyces sp. NPDC054878]
MHAGRAARPGGLRRPRHRRHRVVGRCLSGSAQPSHGPRAIARVLTGTGVDGPRGVTAIGAHGGIVLVEGPRTAQFAGMPAAALESGAADRVLRPEGIAAVLRGPVESKRQR